MRFTASAPCKAILFGEHYVVYGSPALSIAIEPRNIVEFADFEGSGISMHSALGDAAISEDGRFEGQRELGIYHPVANAIFPKGRIPTCTVSFKPSWNLKGAGLSASLCAAFAAGLFKLAGKKPSAEEIFSAAQAGDLIAHGGRASGIDAKTVSFGCPLVFRRSFSPPAFNSKPADFSLPSGSTLLLIDTFKGKKQGTSAMLEIFASQFGIIGGPNEASEEARKEICQEFDPLWKKIEKSMGKATAEELGALMGENHALLKNRKMSSAGIERAVSVALSAGAFGAKLTGGGGEGGAVLALCTKENSGKVSASISESTGFHCHAISLAIKGAGVP